MPRELRSLSQVWSVHANTETMYRHKEASSSWVLHQRYNGGDREEVQHRGTLTAPEKMGRPQKHTTKSGESTHDEPGERVS